ncbi:hypothetical protein E4U42_006748 [Claviceps africana]|uniref:Uncharacterized protein n=1 Tax=Claviceps africana TaxID=83212 RepID=A0A8K0NFJ5_9HYPO|nr:hypothetical protein E4U42_006748 [Claviceps africana]
MDTYGAYRPSDGAFDQDSPRKGGHTLRKSLRVDYTLEHVDENVVVPNSTSSRAKRRRLDHASDAEDLCASALKTRGYSLGADSPAAAAAAAAAVGLRRHDRHDAAYESMLPGAQPGDEEDVKDTIEVSVSYSDMDESEARCDSNASISSVDPSFDTLWKSAPAAPSHVGPLYSDAQAAIVYNKANVLNDSQDEENIDPQLRASPPASPKSTVGMARPAGDVEPRPGDAESRTAPNGSKDGPSPGHATDAPDAAAATSAASATDDTIPTPGQHVEAVESTTQPAAVASQQVTAAEDAVGAKKEPSPPNSPVAEEEEASRVPKSSISDEMQQQPNGAEAAVVPEPCDAARTDVSAALPEMGDTSSSKPNAGPGETDTPRTTQPSSTDVAAKHASEHDAEHAAKSNHPAVADTTDGVPSIPKDQSPLRCAPPPAIPSISIEKVVESQEGDAGQDPKDEGMGEQVKKQEEGQKGRREVTVTKKVQEEGAVVEKTKTKPATPAAANRPHKNSEDHDVVAVGARDALKHRRPSQLGPSKPQPTPTGRWSHLTPYLDGEYVTYPEKRARSDDDACLDETIADDKDGNDMEPMVEDNDDAPDPASTEAQTPALNTPLRGSPVEDSIDPTASNSPAPAGDDADEGDMSDSQEPPERRRCYRYRKLRDADEYVAAIENYEDMSTSELYEVLEAINLSLVQWQNEWNDLGRVVDDHENALRRRVADAKYEARTRNMSQHGVNHEEPDFAVKGYRAKERELMSETRYLQGQDRIMSATYGFEYDPHPSKIGRQNPETQQAGIMTRGRSLRNQPKQTVKASEADEVTGKRQRRPVQLFDPAPQDVVSRGSTPVPSRTRRRRHPNPGYEDNLVNLESTGVNGEENSDAEGGVLPKGRRRRGPRLSNATANAVDELATPRSSGATEHEELGRSGRRRAARQSVRYDDAYAEFMDDDAQPEPKPPQRQSSQHAQQRQQQQQQRHQGEQQQGEQQELSHQHRRPRHILTLKIPRPKNLSEPSSAITDNGDSRPSTASSDSSSHTAESSYSFRPKRQKRFRDDPDEVEEAAQAPPRKRGKRTAPHVVGGGGRGGGAGIESSFMLEQHTPDAPPSVRKVQKIKVVRPAQDVRHDTPSSTAGGDGDEKPKDYKSMTKSEKMSASMKSRWANGNMAGAVEKRKATLAAKKAAQVAADSKVGTIAPKPKVKAPKKEAPPEGHLPAGYVPAMPGINYSFSAAP